MTPEQIKQIRERLGLTLEAFGKALGYECSWRQRAWELENGRRRITRRTQMMAEALVYARNH